MTRFLADVLGMMLVAVTVIGAVCLCMLAEAAIGRMG